MKKRFFSTAGRMVVLAVCIGLLTAGTALAAHLPVPAGAGGAPRSASAPVYALVELTAAPTAAQYAQALNRAASAKTATASAVSQLSVVTSQQASFARAIAAAKLPVTEIYRLQRVYNGILYQVPRDQLDRLKTLAGVKAVHIVTPKVPDNAQTIPFINVPALWTNLGLPVHGEGIRIGVIDTGIDYTHANFAGPGTVAAFNAVNPNVATPGVFPTAKVVGGFDFAGPIYDAASTETRKITPQPDANPIDRSGHGSHVAGTIAGFGVKPDGTTYGQVIGESYDQTFPATAFRIGPGAAPRALLYALKVFGDVAGSTNLAALALEWAVDPNGDGDFSDHLDVVNLSLGSGYGTSDDSDAPIYANAVAAGVAVVASAGNSNDVFFITGAPASTPQVISVAATSVGEYGALSIDSPAGVAGLKPQTGSSPQIPTPDAGLPGTVVASAPVNGCTPFTNAASVAGNIAFVQRGACTFSTKVANAEAAGAIATIVWNNAANGDNLITMALAGTETKPARFIGFTDGTAINTALAGGPVTATLNDFLSVLRPAEADQIASFSSRGPSRTKTQSLLKPDVAAPGVNIVSTGMGTGNKAAQFSGTSMASPLTAGTVALLRQLHPGWGPSDIKALLMNTATHETFNLPSGATGRLPISPTREGAGRIDAQTALNSNVIAFDDANPDRVSVSFATHEISAPATEIRTVTLANAGLAAVTYNVTIEQAVATTGASVAPSATTVVVPAGGTASVNLTLTADPATLVASHDPTVAATVAIPGLPVLPRSFLSETSGWVVFTDQAGVASTLRVPFLATVSPASTMGSSGRILVHGSAAGTATLAPQGARAGSFALPMELAFAGQQAFVDENDFARLKYVGVTSNLRDAGSIANAELFFGVSSFGIWGSPAEVGFQVMIKAAGAPSWQFALANAQPGADVNLTELFGLDAAGNATPLFFEDLLNGVAANQPVPVFLTDTMVLPVSAANIGLATGASAIDYQVQTFSAQGFVEATPVLHYDLAHPAFATSQDATLAQVTAAPYVIDQASTTIPVAFDTTAENGANGMLVLHMSNVAGARAEAIAVAHPRQLTASRTLTPSVTCPAGGVEITTFWDDDNDGQLTGADTIASVNDVCNGASGPIGPQGPPGPKGKGGCASAGGDASILALIGVLALAARRRRTATA